MQKRDELIAALNRFAGFSEPALIGNSGDIVKAGEVCRNSVSLADFQAVDAVLARDTRKEPPMDYRELLKKYMTKVIEGEGTSYVPDDIFESDHIQFSEDQLTALKELESEVWPEGGRGE